MMYRFRPSRRAAAALAVLVAGTAWADPPAAGDDNASLAELSMEQLLNVQVYGASKFAQKSTDAPAAVTVITAADIRDYGYRTLADILRSVRGINISYDRNYEYLGIRGFGRTGDFNGRMLLLVDSHRLNDPVFDAAGIGTDFALDVDLIDRVEIVRGPGSSIYGNNAVFGIINVITKRGRDIGGVELAAETASFGTDRERATWGGQNAAGIEWLLSTTRYKSDGQDLDFPELGGTTRDRDYDHYNDLFGKVSYGPFTLTGAWATRTKGVPTASYNSLFGADEWTRDDNGYLDLGYNAVVSERFELDAHLAYGRYDYQGIYPFTDTAGGPLIQNKDDTDADWWSADGRLVGRFAGHTVVAGAEYQDNWKINQANFDLSPYTLYLDDRRSDVRTGLYLQDEMTLSSTLLLDAGLRRDHYSTFGTAYNPRLGLIWNPRSGTTVKWLYGTAFRAPNAYELYYAIDPQKANPDLDPEQIRSYEMVVEHYLRADFRLTADAYHNHITNLIDQVVDPADGLLVYENRGVADAEGIELEAERLWDDGARLRASYAWQWAKDAATGQRLVNSPRHLAKLNVAAPLFASGWRSGLELQYTGSRTTLAGATAKGYLLTNLTLVNEQLLKNLSLSASIYNLFDQRHADPAGPELINDAGTIDAVPGDGRSYRLKLGYRF